MSFSDIAADAGAGIVFERVPSASNAEFDAIKMDPPYDGEKRVDTPIKARGAPGVVIFDYDGDGDEDIFATNGPGGANGLFSNQLVETGSTTFIDVATAAGVAAVPADGTGACFGDIDNDGDHDLYVTTNLSPNLLFENQGDGTFVDISAASGAAGPPLNPSGCTLGDVNNDGLLDIVVGNTYSTWDDFTGIFEPFALNQHNQLFLNQGGNVFVDASTASGITDLAGFPPGAGGSAGLSWAVALADYDQDGDVDLFTADDQGGVPSASTGGVDRGLLHVFDNDGNGNFTDRAMAAGTNVWGSWMGLSFADFECDGDIDFFGSNFGDYQPVGIPEPGLQPSRWLLQGPGKTFADPGVGDFLTTPFGWGTSTFDYDLDGDADIVFHGGHDVGPGIELGNPGVILQNQGCGNAQFEWDQAALATSTNHSRRVVHGMAVGDLNQDHFPDIVSISNLNVGPELTLVNQAPLGSVFDATAFFILNFEPNASGELVWNGNTYLNGDLSVELNSGGNGNQGITVEVQGAIGLTPRGRVNRDGIGAVVRFRPRGGDWVSLPVVGGSSYASQDALDKQFGLGAARRGDVEVLWPGGVRNRLYNVQAGETVVIPEIPCSFDGAFTFRQYLACTVDALDDLEDAGVVDRGLRTRLLMSALRAFAKDASPNCTAPKSAGLVDLVATLSEDGGE
ncbi:MAG: CRTAC1 family protein [Acidobacteriota bacterium]|nr:CRTAC1 family protein [Acidobacteriota bacterium]